MNKKSARVELNFKVLCAWCEGIIRRDSAKESRGMCLKCYARMLSKHGSARQRAGKPVYASER